MEHKFVQLNEVKASGKDGDRVFEGYGAVFNNIDSYKDIIVPGAFKDYLKELKSGKHQWPKMLSQHGGFGLTSQDLTPIGAWHELEEDSKGLYVKGQLANTPRGLEMYELMKMSPRPAIDGMSIGYYVKEAIKVTDDEQPEERRLTKLHLKEISPVSFPANDEALVASVKSALSGLDSMAEVERFMREQFRLTRGQAKMLISKIKSLDPRDADPDDQATRDAMASLADTIHRNTTILTGV